MLLHLEDAVTQSTVVCTIDTDVQLSAAQRLDITELWIAFGTGKSFQYLAAHEMAKALGPDRCTAFMPLLAVTLCYRFLVKARRVHGILYMDEL